MDGAFEGDKAGARIVIRDYKGAIRAALAFNLKGVMKATHAEALVVWHGINLAKELGLRSLLVETDCSRLVTKMYNWEGFVASWS